MIAVSDQPAELVLKVHQIEATAHKNGQGIEQLYLIQEVGREHQGPGVSSLGDLRDLLERPHCSLDWIEQVYRRETCNVDREDIAKSLHFEANQQIVLDLSSLEFDQSFCLVPKQLLPIVEKKQTPIDIYTSLKVW